MRRRSIGAQPSRYELHVVAPNPVDAIRFAGGLIVDKVMCGWDVTVLVPPCHDVRPLRVLGAGTADLHDDEFCERLTNPASLVAAGVDAGDRRASSIIGSALTNIATEVAFWTVGTSTPALRSFTTTRYPLSIAARAYKSHALTAAGVTPASVAPTEEFRFATAPGRSAASVVGFGAAQHVLACE